MSKQNHHDCLCGHCLIWIIHVYKPYNWQISYSEKSSMHRLQRVWTFVCTKNINRTKHLTLNWECNSRSNHQSTNDQPKSVCIEVYNRISHDKTTINSNTQKWSSWCLNISVIVTDHTTWSLTYTINETFDFWKQHWTNQVGSYLSNCYKSSTSMLLLRYEIHNQACKDQEPLRSCPPSISEASSTFLPHTAHSLSL
jgi:hypothetical protein